MDTVKRTEELIARARITDPRKRDAVVATVLATFTFIESFLEFQHRPQGVLAMVAFTGATASVARHAMAGTTFGIILKKVRQFMCGRSSVVRELVHADVAKSIRSVTPHRSVTPRQANSASLRDYFGEVD